ncbi:hypothetical protein D3C86_2053830 [compost metagenome]
MLRAVAPAPAHCEYNCIRSGAGCNQAILGVCDPEIGQRGSLRFGCRHDGIDHRGRSQAAVNAQHDVDRAGAVSRQHVPRHSGARGIAGCCGYAAENPR